MGDRRRKTTAEPKKKVVRPMPICSFCLGDEKCNRNHQPEGFISCVDCGNSGHPSCLKFSAALTQRVKKTRWQCIDCKRCAKCSGIGRDENMLFCDSCDRGVHMKCCSPPLKELPPGEWFCFLCESNASDVLPSDSSSMTNGQRVASPAATKQIKPERRGLSSAQKSKDTKFRTRNCAASANKQCARSCSQRSIKLNKTSSQGKTDLQPGALVNLSDGLTQFFTPSNKRKTRVSSVSLEGIAATRKDSARDCRTRLYRKQRAVGVALKPSHHRAAKQLIKKSQCIQRKQIQKENEEQKMNYQLRALAVLHDGLTQYFTARGQRKSLFRRTDGASSTNRVSRVQGSSPVAVKRRRRSQRGDHVELLFDGLTHFFTAHGKRPSAFRKPDEEFREPTPVKKESLLERRKRQYKHRTQVQSLFDGLSKFFTARNARRSEEIIHSPRPSPTRKISSNESKDDVKSNSEQSKCCKKRKLEDVDDDLLQSSLKSSSKRVRSSPPAMSSSQRVASRIVEKSRQFKAKKENKKVVRRRRGESCQLKSLFDGLSHLYTAQGERQRKSFNFYCLSVRHQACTSGGGSSIGSEKLENAKELAKRLKPSCQETSVKSPSLSQKSGSTVETGLVKESEEDDVKTSKVVSKNRTVNKPKSNSTAECFATSGKKLKKRSLSRSDVKCLSEGVTKEDLELFRKAKANSSKRFISQEGPSALELGPAQTGPGSIELGKYEITAWHSSTYPLEYASLSKLYICEFCLKCFKSRVVVKGHMTKCVLFHPPGDEIYRSGSLSVYEVDGKVNKQYCQNLCLLAKLFLDHKTLYYDVEPFLFYVLTHTDDGGSHLIGYFSKEKYCQQKYNLSCIMTLPPYQRKGYGRFLIEFSYLLSRLEGQPGSPEKPLSDLGRVSYGAFWKSVVVDYLHKQQDLSNISVQSISEATGLTPGDIVTTLQSLDMMQVKDNSKCDLVVRQSVLAEHLAKVKARQDVRIPLKEDALHWSPFVTILGIEREDKTAPESTLGADQSTHRGRREAGHYVSGHQLTGPAHKNVQKAGERRLRGRGLDGRTNDDFLAEKKCQLNSVPKRRMDTECFEKRHFGRGFDHKTVKEESSDRNDVSMRENTQADKFTRRREEQQFIEAIPQENGNASEKHSRQRLGKSFHGGKKTDRSRVSCNNRSPQVEKDYPNKPRKRTKSSYSAVCSLVTKERQGGSVECQSESRDSSEKSSEVSDGTSTVTSACSLSGLLNRQFGSERLQPQHPCVTNTSDGKQQTIPSFELLPGSGALSVDDEDAEEADDDCLAKVKNLRSIVDVELGNEILPDALNTTQKALPDPGNDGRSLLSCDVHIANQDEGFSSSAEDGSESSAIDGEVKETREDRISRHKRKRTVLPSGNVNIAGENELQGTNLSRDKPVSGSRFDATSSASDSEVAFSSRDCVEKDVTESVHASIPQQVTSASKKFNSRVDANLLQDLDSNVLPTESKRKGVAERDDQPFISMSASPGARKSHRRLLESFEENNADDLKHVDLGIPLTVQGAGGLLSCMEVSEEEENSKTSLTTKSPSDTRKRTVCDDVTVMENGADKALRFSELPGLRTSLGEDRTEVGSTPSCSDLDGAANYESEDEKKMDRSFDSTADFKDSSEYKAERCEAPDYAELFGFQMGDLQDRMDRQTFGQTTNSSVSDSPTESVDGKISSGDDLTSAAGNAVSTASASFSSTADTASTPLQSSCDRTGSDLVYPAADAMPLIGSVEQNSCPVPAVASPLSDTYILTPSPTNSAPLSVGLASPISPADCTGGSTGRPHIASVTHTQVSGHVPDESNSWSDTYRRRSARPLPYPDASSICKLEQLTSRLDESSGDASDDVTMIGLQSQQQQQQQQQAVFQQLSPSLACTALPSVLSPVVRKTPLSSAVEPFPMNRLQRLVPEPNHSDSAFIPLQCGSPFQPPNQQSRFADSHQPLLLQNSAEVQNFQAMSANNRYPHNEDVTGSANLTPLSFHHRSYHSAFHSHIPNLNFVQPPQFTSTSNSRYVASPAPRRYCQSSILTPPSSVERNHTQSRNSQSPGYPLSYWIGPHDQNHVGMRNQDFGFRSSRRSLSSERSPVSGLESSVNSEDCFYNIPYLNSVGAHSLSSAH